VPTTTLERGIEAFFCFLEEPRPWGVSEVAQRLETSKPTASRLLTSLERKGLIARRNSSRKYELSFGMLALVALRLKDLDVESVSLPVLRPLSEATGETAGIYVRMGWQRLCLAESESAHEIRRVGKLGVLQSLTTGSSGRVFLAFMSPDDVDKILDADPLEARTEFSVTDRAAFLVMLEEVKRLGYAIARDETTLGVSGLSVPIKGVEGGVVATLTVSGPSDRWSTARMLEMRQRVVDEAGRLSTTLSPMVASVSQSPTQGLQLPQKVRLN
jgi:DNA-binding IclR family transcriptional regulator